jgi:SAM-dependent methyltransferase
MAMLDATKRFADRVSDYVKYRPNYPRVVIETLAREHGLTPAHIIADIGSETGLLSELFLENGNRVFGVELNAEMRKAGEDLLKGWPKFRSLDATAEATTLDVSSVHWVTAGQAFHWFDPVKAKAEFKRILKPGGQVALVWNERRADTSDFLREYEAMLCEFGTDYGEVKHRDGAQHLRLEKFFGPGMSVHSFENYQDFDFDGVRGRLLSSSYAPRPGHKNHEPMLTELLRTFDKHAKQGHVRLEYDTRLYVGSL